MVSYSWRIYPTFLLFLLGFLVGACPTVTSPSGMSCKDKTECWGGFFCVNNRCSKTNSSSDASSSEMITKEKVLPDFQSKEAAPDLKLHENCNYKNSDRRRCTQVYKGRCCEQRCLRPPVYIRSPCSR